MLHVSQIRRNNDVTPKLLAVSFQHPNAQAVQEQLRNGEEQLQQFGRHGIHLAPDTDTIRPSSRDILRFAPQICGPGTNTKQTTQAQTITTTHLAVCLFAQQHLVHCGFKICNKARPRSHHGLHRRQRRLRRFSGSCPRSEGLRFGLSGFWLHVQVLGVRFISCIEADADPHP